MVFRIQQILCLVLVVGFSSLDAAPDPVAHYFDAPQQVGSTRLRILFWDVYDISLYSEDGQFDPDQPFALRLRYLRQLKGDLIAEKSVEEMRRQGVNEVKLADWFVQMKTIFPDVTRGSELIGVFRPGQPTRFYDSGRLIGEIPDPDFGIPFSRIWLGERSSVPELREKLLGMAD